MEPQRRMIRWRSSMAREAIPENVRRILARVEAAAARAGRKAEEITLVAVSKTHPAEAISVAFEAGIRHFGENRVQEWEAKRATVLDLPAQWHLVGHLQSNKAARAAKLFHSVDSVDNFALAERLHRAREQANAPGKLRVLIEVRLAPEEAKSGVEIAELPRLVEQIAALEHLHVAGLMCIPPYRENPEDVRPFFRRLRQLRDGLEKRFGRKLGVLSMGMSHDFEVAIEEGATEVRIGTALFGDRPKI